MRRQGITRAACWILAGLLCGCASIYPRRDPVGEIFPAVRGSALDGREFDLPADLAGEPALLFVGYEMNSQFDIDRWLIGVHQSGLRVRALELPAIPGLIPGLFAGSIDGGMRSGIPEEDWGAVVTIYDDAETIARFLGNENPLPARVLLLDREGRVVYFHDRGFSVAALQELKRRLESLGGAAGAAWPGWRGPTRDGLAPQPLWPPDLQGLEPIWRRELGPSYSGPVLDAGRVYVTESVEGKFEVVRALDRRDGEEIWDARWEGSMTVPFFALANGSWIRSTPALDEGRLFVAGMRDVLHCLDAATGKALWSVDFVERYGSPLPSFGFVCSPLVSGRHVYVQAGGGLVKLDKESGESVWRVLDDGGGMYGSAFSSPALAEIAGRSQLLVQTRSRLAGVDPEDGEVLWARDVPAFRGMNILTPTPAGGGVFTSSYGGGTFLFEIAAEGGSLSAKERWKDPAQGYMSSPVMIDGHLYLHLRNQRIACFEAASGQKRWTTSERFGKYMSLACQEDRILALDERGILFLFRAGPEGLETIDSREVSEQPTWAHLAVAGGEIAIRELNAIALYRWPAGG